MIGCFMRVLCHRPVRLAARHLPFSLFLLGLMAYGAALAWYTLVQFDLGSLLRRMSDDAFYYFQIARNLAAGEFSTFDGGITRTNGYHPLWLLIITPAYWIFDPRAALFAIRALEILLIAGGVALIAAAARLARLPWILLLAAPAALYQQRGMLLGLEAAASLAMLGLLVLAVVLAACNPPRWTWLLAAVAFALPWVRLELAAVSVTATAMLCAIEWSRRDAAFGAAPAAVLRTIRYRPFVPLVAACAGIALYLAYNGLVFGGAVPVSGATKQWWAGLQWEREGGYSFIRSVSETRDTWPFDEELLLALEFCLSLPLMWWLVGRARDAEDRLALAFLAGAFSLGVGHLAKFAQTVLTMHPGLHIFPWYFVPAYLMAALLVPVRAWVAWLVVRRLVAPRWPRVAGVVRPAIVATGAASLLVGADLGRPFGDVDQASASAYRSWQLVSYTGTQVMNRVLPAGSVVGSWDAGVVGYFSHFPVVNLDGLVNSHEYLRATRAGNRGRLRREYGITHFANVEALDHAVDRMMFEGAALSGPTADGRLREFKLWPAARTGGPAGAMERGDWFWERMSPHFDYRQDDVGVVVDEGMAQVFVRHCVPEELRDRRFWLSWTSGERGEPAGAWYAWDSPRRNDLGLCVTVFEPPGDAVRIREVVAVNGRGLGDFVERLVGDRQPLIRSNYDVYLSGNTLVYVADPCSRDDVDRRFFVHVFAADPGFPWRLLRPRGVRNLHFDFHRAGMRAGDRCVAIHPLPAYAIARIVTGQYVPGQRRFWEDVIDFHEPRAGVRGEPLNGACETPSSHPQPLEDALRDGADERHHRPPDAPDVHDVAAPAQRDDQRLGNLRGRRGQASRQVYPVGHAGAHEPRLDRHDVHTGRRQPVAQARQEGCQPRLGRAVDVVRGAPSLARDGAQAYQHAATARREAFGERAQQQRGTDVVGSHHPLCGCRVALAPSLIAEQPDHAHGHVGQRIEGVGERGAAVCLQHVAQVRGDGHAGPQPDVPHLPLEARRIARSQLQRVALFRQPARHGSTDVRRRTHHERGVDSGGHSPSLRDRLEANVVAALSAAARAARKVAHSG